MTPGISGTVPEAIIRAFTIERISHIIVVPCTGLNPLYSHYERMGQCIYATREEEAIAIASGLAIGGALPAVVMQQSGVGNTLNAVFTLADAYCIYFPVVVLDRGVEDINPVQ